MKSALPVVNHQYYDVDQNSDQRLNVYMIEEDEAYMSHKGLCQLIVHHKKSAPYSKMANARVQ